MTSIRLWGAKQNNLKGIELEIPLESFTVICGPSGSGKSSIAFETLYAEGQRRYIESLSNYSRQFLSKMPKPDLEGIENIPPAIAIEQKNSVKSSRSSVGTTTEIIDYLRLIFEKVGKVYCPNHHVALQAHSPSSAADKVLSEFSEQRGYVACLISAEHRLYEGKKLLATLLQEGYSRYALKVKAAKKATKSRTTTKKVLASARSVENYSQEVLGDIFELSDPALLKRGLPKDDFYLIVDRLAFTAADQGRLVDSLAQAFSASVKLNKNLLSGQIKVFSLDGRSLLLSEDPACTICGYSFPPITSNLFSFNSPVGACENCKGFGNLLTLDESKVIPNPELSLADGAINPFAMPSASYDRRELKKFCERNKIDMHKPWKALSPKQRELLWKGTKEFYGVVGLFEYLETKKYKMHVRVFISRYKSPSLCPECKGSRLKKQAQQVLILGQSISDLCNLSVDDLHSFMHKLQLAPHEEKICAEPLRQARERLFFLKEVGVGYLTLDRPTRTLSGGEFQRLNLANQLGMGLSQTLYVLDEPTVGLHPRDNTRLINILKNLNALGNTLVVVEHDYDVIQSSSHVIEMGPGSGHLGGDIIFNGPTQEFFSAEKSNTVEYLRPNPSRALLRQVRPVDINTYRYVLDIRGCTGHNLKDLSVRIPLHRLVTITGVSGSGKSTLIGQTLYPALARKVGLEYIKGEDFAEFKGAEHVKHLVFIDQSPVGKTARSNPVTYLKIYDAIRTIMASTSDARDRGYEPGTFSLNVDGGRCPVCKGLGYEMIDMVFMDDIEVKCDTCNGKRFRPEVLDVKYKNQNIHEILNMTVSEAMDFFVQYPNIRKPLSILKEVGLDYIRIGQSANSFSGGESQRLKVARELTQMEHRGALYILDEPTTGLHFREVHLLMRVLNKLVEAGSSVILIEHNLEVIKNSDYIIDLGPEAGIGGGRVVAVGTPEEIMQSKKSHTGKYLKEYIEDLGAQRRQTQKGSNSHPAVEASKT